MFTKFPGHELIILLLISLISDTIIPGMMYIYNVCTDFAFLKHKVSDKLDIDRNTKQPRN